MNTFFRRTKGRLFGTYPLKGEVLAQAVSAALAAGYRAFDTAQMSIIWEVKGPKNIWPPSIDGGDGWSDWVVLGPA